MEPICIKSRQLMLSFAVPEHFMEADQGNHSPYQLPNQLIALYRTSSNKSSQRTKSALKPPR